ncbi:MAG: D-alanyl-D-alanine carboxypeptidase/D-alanyl-D-alanine-endopeptidase [Ilumatobacteraceae bacterium]
MLAALAAVPAIALAGVWQYADANVPPPTTTTTTTLPPPPVEALATDLLSFRRHPSPLADRVAAAASEAATLERVAALAEGIGDGSCVRLVSGGDVIAETNPVLPVIPASNEKLLVAAVALETLGTDHRFRTELRSLPPSGTVVVGDLYLVGGGDPLLRTADMVDPQRHPAVNTTALEPLADQLVTLGITRIDGNIVGDGSRYDDEFRAPSWGDELTSVDAGPYDALLVNDGLIAPGEYGLDPSRSAARIFLDLLTARGISVGGSAANDTRPDDPAFTTLASIESAPLDDVLVEMLHTSDNNTAEMMVKEIGVAAGGQGTRQAGLDVIRSTLATWGVPLDGVDLQDGSGLSRSDRVTCTVLSDLLSVSPVADQLRSLLPVAGRDGTLADQLVGTEAEGELQAKTGTLTGVKALTGSMRSADRTQVEFSLVLNGDAVDEPSVYEPVWKRIVALVADLPIVVRPDVGSFAPR